MDGGASANGGAGSSSRVGFLGRLLLGLLVGIAPDAEEEELALAGCTKTTTAWGLRHRADQAELNMGARGLDAGCREGGRGRTEDPCRRCNAVRSTWAVSSAVRLTLGVRDDGCDCRAHKAFACCGGL